MLNDNILDKVLDKTKEIIGIEKFDDIKIFIDNDDKFPDDIVFVILKTCAIKDGDKSIYNHF